MQILVGNFHSSIRRSLGFSLALALAAVAPITGSCASERKSSVDPKMREEGRALFGTPEPDADSPDSRARVNTANWTIVLEAFRGANRNDLALRRLAPVQQLVGRPDVRVQDRDSSTAIVVGDFQSYDEPAAQQLLDHVREISVAGRRPFKNAFIAPPPVEADPGRIPELNLASARSLYGEDAMWTLQIAVYESPDPATAKRAAEDAAARLRREGELAFYYHGPTRSMVTIGAWGTRDYDEQTGILNPSLASLKEKYPLNLLNGQFPIVVKRPGVGEAQQRSMLVRIPE